MSWFILAGSIAVILVAFVLRRKAKTCAAGLGFPAGQLVYQDTLLNKDILVSQTHGLTGKPDYIFRNGDNLIPVERKSRRVSSTGPYEGELLQLAAYCILVESEFGQPVFHGQLQYLNRSINIPFGKELRRNLLATLNDVKEAEHLKDVPRSHRSPARCRGCGFRDTCKDSLISINR